MSRVFQQGTYGKICRSKVTATSHSDEMMEIAEVEVRGGAGNKSEGDVEFGVLGQTMPNRECLAGTMLIGSFRKNVAAVQASEPSDSASM